MIERVQIGDILTAASRAGKESPPSVDEQVVVLSTSGEWRVLPGAEVSSS